MSLLSINVHAAADSCTGWKCIKVTRVFERDFPLGDSSLQSEQLLCAVKLNCSVFRLKHKGSASHQQADRVLQNGC
jgi:hypothetical protein